MAGRSQAGPHSAREEQEAAREKTGGEGDHQDQRQRALELLHQEGDLRGLGILEGENESSDRHQQGKQER